MAQSPYTNDTAAPVHLDGKRILPGQTRLVDETLLPQTPVAPTEPAEDPGGEGGNVLDLLDGTEETIRAAIPELSLDQLQELRTAEENGKTRKGVTAALDEAILDRAGGEGDG